MPKWLLFLLTYPYSPTLPFLIGALREVGVIPLTGGDFEQVYALFQDMASYRIPDGNIVLVDKCPDLLVPVFSKVSEAVTSDAAGYPARYPSDEPGATHLCFSAEIERGQDIDLENVVRRVFEGYGHRQAMASRYYSRDRTRRVWRPFDEEDLFEIHRALGQ